MFTSGLSLYPYIIFVVWVVVMNVVISQLVYELNRFFRMKKTTNKGR